VKTCCLTLALLACALKLSADPTNNVPLKIGTIEATNYFGQTMTVTGTVAQVTAHPSIMFLNMDQPYPKSPFTLVIFSSNAPKFGDLKALTGKAVEATGKIKNYHNKPEMVLDSTNQLKVLSDAVAK
jgi:DNA/RNA endonuclease YhcR with UshA esterase domain